MAFEVTPYCQGRGRWHGLLTGEKINQSFDVFALRDLYQPDMERLALARRRQAALWRGERPDAWPALLWGDKLPPPAEKIPQPDYQQAFEDADLMLASQMRGAIAAAYTRSDAVPSIRVNFGTGVCLACLGLEQEIFKDKMPWMRMHLSTSEIARLEPDDIRIRGSFERGLEYMRRFREVMGETVPIYCMDTQGPFDLAHLMYGDDIFYAVHDDPPFMHHLMELALELGIRTHRWMKEISGEPIGMLHHGNMIYAENMGIRICEDTTVIVSPQTMEEFALPYTRRLAQAFGGAWVHYCGCNNHLTARLCAIPEVRGINFGHVPGHHLDHVFEEDMRRCQAAGKVYYGDWPRWENERGLDYLKRLHGWASQGALLPMLNMAIHPSDDFTSLEEVLECWYSL